MGKIYVNQTKCRFTFIIKDDDGDTIDISTASVRRIKYRSRTSSGFWNATGGDYANGELYYDVQVGDLDSDGAWVLWTYVTFADGKSAPSESHREIVYNEGE